MIELSAITIFVRCRTEYSFFFTQNDFFLRHWMNYYEY